MNTGEKTKRYAVIGHPVAHSLSPVMHNANFQANGDTDCTYEREDVAPADLERFILENPNGYSGLSVTIPHKEALFRIMEELYRREKRTNLDPHAHTAKAVNTIKYTDAGPLGYNTDGLGFIRAFEEKFGPMKGLDVFIFGRGGSAKAIESIMRSRGADSVVITGRDQMPGIVVQRAVVINATPVGLHPESDPQLFQAAMFGTGVKFAVDLIYKKYETQFVRAATEAGVAVMDGLGMLLHQGAAQYKIWTGKEANIEVMRAALNKALGRTE